METIYLTIVLAPLIGAIIAGLWRNQVGKAGAHWVTIIGVGISCVLSIYVLLGFTHGDAESQNLSLYTWMVSDGLRFEIGFLVDQLTAMMMAVVTFVSLMVHIYTVGYMAHEEGYQRFFSYIALFTFSMLMLVMSNNFMQLFFGWEAVGLVSYLLIGFYFKKETAIFANLKAFLVNRVGDFGFILGIAAIAMYTNSLDYAEVFEKSAGLANEQITVFPGTSWSLMTVICVLLFIGAMGKSAQMPLHVWLPDSMEGPTPISALIHAATMVTAGIFMVARMSPLYELSETALSFVLIIGATTAFFTGLIGIVQNDIKRVVAYSTLSQLGYMIAALGASAYAAGVFHLMTHAFFKALLFLAAGSVIIGMHHDQDIRNMGGIRKYMPITWITSLLGSLALIGTPFFSGFFSKDAIIESVHLADRFGTNYAYYLLVAGVFVTALYSFRMFFLVFHGNGPRDEHAKAHLHESPWVVTVPLVLLAIPSVVIGWFTIEPMLFGEFFKDAIYVDSANDVLAHMGEGYHGALGFVVHSVMQAPFWLALGGFLTAWYIYMMKPSIALDIKVRFDWLYTILDRKYGFDELFQYVFAGGSRMLGKIFWKGGDQFLIDGVAVNGSAHGVGWLASVARYLQTGFLNHYAIAMILGLIGLVGWFVILQ
ncbi:NADH-quinone oxidoreductase subunit L [Solemya velum gill symbiont]|uniref:NADH-quinone oxidoreductase subunit L n=1 Tax=Solemya velum gill symbiont TaxID=2340 RepID=UPI00099735E1|nr:NADH-quinone oxidoreductase subunit L [Solemya velum gill symbiont]OOZ15458.1 NADH-quinone oxidoreductase subunit L [Solemya velum gill symbiont]OOZ20036.1 NADH-quinone oxidoreductase subunit L [Solemya velum gill symbiont]OOZ22752.1 NADH-quinone oxidoreductase subunit L [Solemya velum gill symbiont]OOZ24940.1 NADH-quinone oxidoreductase subunit L [Solemya velum gill symbiont]OOZ29781.1 NADH-quinone oxidoreductase subunit L [Solemya velum gill symbiont]